MIRLLIESDIPKMILANKQPTGAAVVSYMEDPKNGMVDVLETIRAVKFIPSRFVNNVATAANPMAWITNANNNWIKPILPVQPDVIKVIVTYPDLYIRYSQVMHYMPSGLTWKDYSAYLNGSPVSEPEMLRLVQAGEAAAAANVVPTVTRVVTESVKTGEIPLSAVTSAIKAGISAATGFAASPPPTLSPPISAPTAPPTAMMPTVSRAAAPPPPVSPVAPGVPLPPLPPEDEEGLPWGMIAIGGGVLMGLMLVLKKKKKTA